jgi:hypothetical protein
MLLGLALAFAAVASLASVAGGWAVEANRYGRTAAFVVMTLFGLTLLLPTLAARMTSPIVSVGSRLANWAEQPTMSAPACSPPRWPCSPLPCWPLPKGDRGLRRHHRRDLEAV